MKIRPGLASIPSIEPLESRIAPATFLVTTLADAGAGSLRQAILDANASAGGDTVVFDPALNGEISLTTGRMDITGPLKIKGPVAKTIVIDAAGTSQIFNIDDGVAGTLSPVEISNLGMTNGSSGGNAGGIIFSNEPISLINSSLTGGFTTSAGGGLFADTDGKVTIKNSVIADNGSTEGGGLWIRAGAGLQIVGSSITGNASASLAGGVNIITASVDPGKVVIDRTAITGNSAMTQGGGLFAALANPAAPMTIKSSFFGYNQAGGDGGGAHLADGSFAVEKTIFSSNSVSSDNGAGLYASTDVDKISIKGSSFTGNTGANNGGGVALFSVNSPATIAGSVFSGNEATFGGGIRVIGGDAGYTIAGSSFYGNSASQTGGGIFGSTGAGHTGIIKSSTFSNNDAGNDGGGIYSGDDTLLLDKVLLVGNTSANIGGGFANTGDVDLTVKSSRFLGNSATNAGGGVHFDGNGALGVMKSVFDGNEAPGAALHATLNNTANLVGNVIVGNTAATSGGGIFVGAGLSATLNGGKVLTNTAPVAADISGAFTP